MREFSKKGEGGSIGTRRTCWGCNWSIRVPFKNFLNVVLMVVVSCNPLNARMLSASSEQTWDQNLTDLFSY